MNNYPLLNISVNSNSGDTKLQQLTSELLRVIKGYYKEGEILPSINSLSKKLELSRDTVFKAYSELKSRGIIDSTPAKGYFVNCLIKKVLLLLDYYSPFKDIVYREIENKLDSTYSIDLVFHHYNSRLFDSVILESAGKYNFYVVMNIDTKTLKIADILKKIDSSKLLLLDIPVNHWNNLQPERYNYIWQDFDEAVFNSLSEIKDRIIKYKTFHFINPDRLQHPLITQHAFVEFCKQNAIQGNIINSSKNINIKKKEAYFVLRQRDLNAILLQAKEKKIVIGKDVGILCYNDSPLYEFVSNGITVISTDFKKMAHKASQFIIKGSKMKEIIPTKIILRNSL